MWPSRDVSRERGTRDERDACSVVKGVRSWKGAWSFVATSIDSGTIVTLAAVRHAEKAMRNVAMIRRLGAASLLFGAVACVQPSTGRGVRAWEYKVVSN